MSIGTELLLGTITDTNASYIAQRLAVLGIDCFYVSQVGDNLGRLVETLDRAWERSDLTVTTGGLGPTLDDLTREAIAAMLGETPVVNAELEADLKRHFARRGVEMPQRNLKQATLIPSAASIANPIGSAPGWLVRGETASGRRMIVSMPGVPFEMKRMWEQEVEPLLRSSGTEVITSRTLKILGLGESAVEEMVADLMSGSNPTLAPYAKQDGVHLRITAKGAGLDAAEEEIAGLEAKVRERLGAAIYGTDDDTPHGVVGEMLRELGLKFVLLEVGDGAVGSISPLLGSDMSALGAFAAPDLAALTRLLGGNEAGCCATLEDAAMSAQKLTEADVVVAIEVSSAPQEEQIGSLLISSEIVVLAPVSGEQQRVTRHRQSWRTAPSEARRLVGLSAISLLRHRLLRLRAG